jgi:chemotaxis signal transduction protein
MTADTQRRIQLRVQLHSGVCSLPLHRVHRLVGYATLTGQPDDYFLGWLTFHGQQVPVFDLNRIVCDQPTAETFGTRIILVETSEKAPTPILGLLAEGVTDTLSPETTFAESIDLDSFLPMLYTLTPEVPAAAA